MYKFVLLLLGLLFYNNGIQAQGWIDQRVNTMRQRNQQRTIRGDDNQRTYRNNQVMGRQERLYQHNNTNQSRNNSQRQNNAESYNSSKGLISSKNNNQIQGNDKVVTLVTNGTGKTKEEATRVALRSAIEQAYGTFVSANTEVLNDNLIKDEIVTISSGNIQSYEELSCSNNEAGLIDVSVKVIVSINKLVEFARSKGMNAELSGASFVMNMKMRDLNKKNEYLAYEQMLEKVKQIARQGLFDYNLVINDPQKYTQKKGYYTIKIKVQYFPNDNYRLFFNTISDFVKNLSLSRNELLDYQRSNYEFYKYDEFLGHPRNNGNIYVLRNNYSLSFLPIIISNALSYVIKDNLGNQVMCNSKEANRLKYHNRDYYLVWKYGINTEIDRLFYMEPTSRIVGVNNGSDYLVPLYIIPKLNNKSSELLNERTVFSPAQSDVFYEQELYLLYSEEELTQVQSIEIEYLYSNQLDVSLFIKKVSDNIVISDNKISAEILDQEAEFINGKVGLKDYLSRSVRYPVVAEENGIQGVVIVQFDVEINGSISNIVIAKSVDPSLDKEAIRVVKNMPKWKPATKDGKAVRSQNSLKVPFRLQ